MIRKIDDEVSDILSFGVSKEHSEKVAKVVPKNHIKQEESALTKYIAYDKEVENEEIIPCCTYFLWGLYIACCTEVLLSSIVNPKASCNILHLL